MIYIYRLMIVNQFEPDSINCRKCYYQVRITSQFLEHMNNNSRLFIEFISVNITIHFYNSGAR